MKVKGQWEVGQTPKEKAELKRWMLGVMRGEELGAPEWLRTAVEVDGQVLVVQQAPAGWEVRLDVGKIWIGGKFYKTTPSDRLALLGALMGQARLTEDAELVAAWSEALAQVLASTFKAVTAGLVESEAVHETDIAWKFGEGVESKIG